MLSGQVAVVIGAGAGLGRSVALDLAEKGAKVVLCALTPDRVNEVRREIVDAGGEAIAVVADARVEADVERLFADSQKAFGNKLDIVVCGVGEGLIKSTVETDISELRKVLEDNMIPVYLVNRAALKQMLPQKSGLIVNIASRAALVGAKSPLAVYTAGKTAAWGFTLALAREVKKDGINVVCIAPAPMNTPSRRKHTSFDLNRAMLPEKVASLVSFFALNPDITLEDEVIPVAMTY